MGCACKGGAGGAGSSTFEVVVNDRVVYASTSEAAANTVAERYDNATVRKPGDK